MTGYNTGGPAFPITAGNAVYGRGMTLRDWFAGQVLSASIQKWEGSAPENWPDVLASLSYEFADAMIAVREK